MKLGPFHLNRLLLIQLAIAGLSAYLALEEKRIEREKLKRGKSAV